MSRLSAGDQDDGSTATVVAQAPLTASPVGEVPIWGGTRAGPLGRVLPARTGSHRVRPSAIRIDAARVDAAVETVAIVDGVMQNPSGPWVVAWYQDSARLGGIGNTVMAGHVDDWAVGPAVFWSLKALTPG